jgi:hypothetical protein
MRQTKADLLRELTTAVEISITVTLPREARKASCPICSILEPNSTSNGKMPMRIEYSLEMS